MGMLAGAGVPSSAMAAEVLLLHVLECDRAYLYAHPEKELDTDRQRTYQDMLERRAAGMPTQYLTGRQEFWGLNFRVEPGVLIPRPETEHVVEVALKIVRENLMKPAARIVDVGTGSGCIALALAHELPLADIRAVDISEDALRLAGCNAERLGLANRVRFLQGDLLSPFLPNGATPTHVSRARHVTNHEPRFDLIVSNPPYISRDEEGALPREVREHEPHAALFSPEEGLGTARRLLEQAEQALCPGGHIVLELGYNQAERIRGFIGDDWTNVEITNDLRGIPRVLATSFPRTMGLGEVHA